MALLKNVTKKIDITHEPGEWAIIRKLTWKQLARASESRADTALDKMRRMGGEVMGVISKLQDEVKAERSLVTERATSGLVLLDGKTGEAIDEQQAVEAATPKKAKRLIDQYDLGIVLGFGIANLSYSEKFVKEDVDELDQKTAEFLGEELLKFAGVGLSDDEQKAETKNG